MPRLVDRTGQRFGKLVVLARNGTNHYKKVLWRCRCDCGNETDVVAGALVTGNTSSCGCVIPNLKHGGTGKSSYNTWRAMMRRCYNPKDKDFPKYGARGVYVYAPWHDYATFAKDVGEPKIDQTLDRIDPYGNYTPDNCRWASPTTQCRNIRMSKRNKSGVCGVLNIRGRWYAQITAKRRVFRSKPFNSIEDAAVARKDLERLHWGGAS